MEYRAGPSMSLAAFAIAIGLAHGACGGRIETVPERTAGDGGALGSSSAGIGEDSGSDDAANPSSTGGTAPGGPITGSMPGAPPGSSPGSPGSGPGSSPGFPGVACQGAPMACGGGGSASSSGGCSAMQSCSCAGPKSLQYAVECDCPQAVCACSIDGMPTGLVVPYAGCPYCGDPSPAYAQCGFPQ